MIGIGTTGHNDLIAQSNHLLHIRIVKGGGCTVFKCTPVQINLISMVLAAFRLALVGTVCRVGISGNMVSVQLMIN